MRLYRKLRTMLLTISLIILAIMSAHAKNDEGAFEHFIEIATNIVWENQAGTTIQFDLDDSIIYIVQDKRVHAYKIGKFSNQVFSDKVIRFTCPILNVEKAPKWKFTIDPLNFDMQATLGDQEVVFKNAWN